MKSARTLFGRSCLDEEAHCRCISDCLNVWVREAHELWRLWENGALTTLLIMMHTSQWSLKLTGIWMQTRLRSWAGSSLTINSNKLSLFDTEGQPCSLISWCYFFSSYGISSSNIFISIPKMFCSWTGDYRIVWLAESNWRWDGDDWKYFFSLESYGWSFWGCVFCSKCSERRWSWCHTQA